MTNNQPNGELKRVIGVWGLGLCIVNYVVGSAIFAVPAVVGLQLGGYAIFGYLLGGLMMASIMLCYAETGSRITTNGGTYAYVKAAFGEFPAYVINWLFTVAWSILSDAAIINLFADSLGSLFPVFSTGWVRVALIFTSISFMMLVNIIGARQGILFIKLVTVLKLLPLFGIIILGFPQVQTSAFHFDKVPALSSFGAVMLVLFFAFPGFESALNSSGEIKNPQRTVPRGILIGGLFIVLFYLLIQYVTQGILGTEMEAAQKAPLSAAATKIMGPAGGKLLLFTAALSCFGTVFADILNGPRLLFAGAKDGLFPAFLGKSHPRYCTPTWSIIVYAVLIAVISPAGGFEQLAILATASILLIYLAVVLATVKLRTDKNLPSENSFRMPGGLLFPLIAIGTICWLLCHLKPAEIIATILFLLFVSVVYFVSKKLITPGNVFNTDATGAAVLKPGESKQE